MWGRRRPMRTVRIRFRFGIVNGGIGEQGSDGVSSRWSPLAPDPAPAWWMGGTHDKRLDDVQVKQGQRRLVAYFKKMRRKKVWFKRTSGTTQKCTTQPGSFLAPGLETCCAHDLQRATCNVFMSMCLFLHPFLHPTNLTTRQHRPPVSPQTS
jgi:hypothetical protein